MFIRSWWDALYHTNGTVASVTVYLVTLRCATDWVWCGTSLPQDKRKDYFTLITEGNEHLRTCTPSRGNFSAIAQVVKHLINYAQTNLVLQPSLPLPVWWNSQCLGDFSRSVLPFRRLIDDSLHAGLELGDCWNRMRVHIHLFPYKWRMKWSKWSRTRQQNTRFIINGFNNIIWLHLHHILITWALNYELFWIVLQGMMAICLSVTFLFIYLRFRDNLHTVGVQEQLLFLCIYSIVKKPTTSKTTVDTRKRSFWKPVK